MCGIAGHVVWLSGSPHDHVRAPVVTAAHGGARSVAGPVHRASARR